MEKSKNENIWKIEILRNSIRSEYQIPDIFRIFHVIILLILRIF